MKNAVTCKSAVDDLMRCEDYFRWRELEVEPDLIAEGYAG